MSKDREPSIHITVSDLAKVLKGLGAAGLSAEDVARAARKYAIWNRSMVLDKVYAEKKLEKEAINDNVLFKYMYKLYTMTVRSKHKFHPKRFKLSDARTLALISTVTMDALDFCEMHSLEREVGFKTYLDIGLEKSPKLAALAGSVERIQEAYTARQSLTNNIGTEELYQVYSDHIATYTGQAYTLRSATIMLKFQEAALYCDTHSIEYYTFIAALFGGLAWKSGIPSPSMFSSDYGMQLVYEHLGKAPSTQNAGFVNINLKDLRDD